jgi:hypothetical protein
MSRLAVERLTPRRSVDSLLVMARTAHETEKELRRLAHIA